MTALPRLPRPGGITIEVVIPRWLGLLLRTSIAVFLAALLLFILVQAMLAVVRGKSDGDFASAGPALSLVAGDFSARPIEYTVQLTAGSEEARGLDNEWTLLLSSGAVHWANVVEGPDSLKPGETETFRLTFLFDPRPEYGEPVSLRWDPQRKVTASLMLEPGLAGP